MIERNISWSEIQAWCACRKRWWWTYDVGIVPKVAEPAPSVGSCGHAAIAAWMRGGSWQLAVDRWLEAELKKELFDEQKQARVDIANLIKDIMPRYIQHYQDRLEPVLVEARFEIPVRGLKIRLAGYWDAIVRAPDGELWLMEHKFPQKRFRSPEDLELDAQIGIYQYAAIRLGMRVVGTIYNQLLARTPALPKMNKDGTVSKAVIYTSWEIYRDFVAAQGLDVMDYLDMKDKLAEFRFFQRDYIYRGPKEVQLFVRDVERRIWEITQSRKHIYRCESHIVCGRCPYRELCLAELRGHDVAYIIETAFEPRKSREEETNDGEKDDSVDAG